MQRDLVRDEPLRLAQPVWEQLDNFHHHQPPLAILRKIKRISQIAEWPRVVAISHKLAAPIIVFYPRICFYPWTLN